MIKGTSCWFTTLKFKPSIITFFIGTFMSFIRRTSAMFIALLSVISFTACSDEQAKDHAVSPSVIEAPQADSEQAITQRLTTLGLPVEAIHDSEVDGFKQVETPFGIFYVSDDGKHFIQGRIFEFDENGNMKDLLATRFAKLVDSQSENMIVFPAKTGIHFEIKNISIISFRAKAKHLIKRLPRPSSSQ